MKKHTFNIILVMVMFLCLAQLSMSSIPPTSAADDNYDWIEATTEPTYTEQNYTTQITLNDENNLDNNTPPHEHHFVRVPMVYPAVIPYCDQYWEQIDECIICHKTIVTFFQPAYVDHYWTESVIPATCTENGWISRFCARHDTPPQEEEIIALGHTESKKTTTLEPTCTEEGTWKTHCTTCNKPLNTGTIPPHRHHFKKVDLVYPAVIPHCDSYWHHEDKCIYCDKTITKTYQYCDNIFSPDHHIYSDNEEWYHTESDILVQNQNTHSTYEENWYISSVCNLCGETISPPFPPSKVDHYWDNGTIIIPATCTENGKIQYNCTKCNKARTEIIIAPDHTESKKTTTLEPTCTEEGTWKTHCTTCNKPLNTGTIPPFHYWSEIVTEPTCTEQGYTMHFCANDETHNYVDDYVSATDHVWGEFDYSQGRVLFADPVAKCERCMGYDYVYSWIITKVEPTCTADGYTQYERSDGWMGWTYDEGSMLGHEIVVTDLGWGLEYRCERQDYETHIYADELYAAIKVAQNVLDGDFSTYTEESVVVAKTLVNNKLGELETLKYYLFTGEMTQANLDNVLLDINIDDSIVYAQTLLATTPPKPTLLEKINAAIKDENSIEYKTNGPITVTVDGKEYTFVAKNGNYNGNNPIECNVDGAVYYLLNRAKGLNAISITL